MNYFIFYNLALSHICTDQSIISGLIREKISVKTHMLTALYSTTYSKFETFLERITARQELIVIGHVHEDRYTDLNMREC